MLFTELEPSILCPISMSYAVTPALRSNAALHAGWGPKLASPEYDPSLKSLQDKPGVTDSRLLSYSQAVPNGSS